MEIVFSGIRMKLASTSDLIDFALDQSRMWNTKSGFKRVSDDLDVGYELSRAWEYFALAIARSDDIGNAQKLADKLPLKTFRETNTGNDLSLISIKDKILSFREEEIPLLPDELTSVPTEKITSARDVVDLLNKAVDVRSIVDEIIQQNESKIKENTVLINKWHSDAEAQIDSLRNLVIEKISLNKPIELWKSLAAHHKYREDTYIYYAKWFGFTSAIAPLLIGFCLLQNWAPISIGPEVSPNVDLAFKSFTILLILTLCLWATRLAVRYLMVEHHLALDASARAAMAETYLGLRADDVLEATDRAIILNALFRPVTDGLVSDDGMPLTSAAALATTALTRHSKPG